MWGFGVLASEVEEGGTSAFDRKVILWMRHPGDLSPRGSRSFQEAARDVTGLGGVTVLGLVTMGAVGFLILDGKRNMAAFASVSVIGGTMLSVLLKDMFHRPRPEIVPHVVYAANSSFPSGHSMMSTVTYLTLAALLARSQEKKRLKAYFLLSASCVCILVGASRVYMGVHWPTDVLGGWMAGSIWAAMCWLIARWLQSRRALEPEADHSNG